MKYGKICRLEYLLDGIRICRLSFFLVRNISFDHAYLFISDIITFNDHLNSHIDPPRICVDNFVDS